MRLTWVGHSTVLLQLDGVRLLTDPVLRDRVGFLRRRHRAVLRDLSRLDAVLVSHAHMDHLDWRSIATIDRETPMVVPAGVSTKAHDRRRVVAMMPGDATVFGSVSVTATQAEHDGRRLPFGPRRAALGYRIEGSQNVYFAGDTGLFDDMAAIGDGGLDLALLPVWGWGSRLPPGHLSPFTAARALKLLRPRIAIPIHWGTFGPGITGRRSPGYSDDPPQLFARHAAAMAPHVEIIVLQPGGSVELDRRRGSIIRMG